MGRLDGKVAIITGAARGQGEAEARLFASEGAKVVLGDVLDDLGEAVAKDIGDAARYVHLDISSEADWRNAIAVATSMGPYRVLVNNAAIIRPAAIEDTSTEAYLSVIMVNQVGTFIGMRESIAALRAAGGGSIVNISSVDGMKGCNGLVSYNSSKWAVRGMTKAAALEFGQYGIRVNSVHPGGVNTPMGNPMGDDDAVNQAFTHQAIPRIGEPIEIAQAALFLASDDASYITGAELAVDGGWMAGRIVPELPGSRLSISGVGYNA
jgi:3alpha(or 20beta)-hydroxysteroid dehydrogenase